VKGFSLIGAGSLGGHLVNALLKKNYTLEYVYKKTKYPDPRLEAAIETDLGLIVEKSDFIVIAAQESAIRRAAEITAAASDPRGKIFFHTANALHSGELVSLKEKGALTASFSPLQTFIKKQNDDENLFNGVYFLAEGDEPAIKLAKQIAADLGAHVLVVEKEDKPYIHIAAVSASNFLIAILELAGRQLKKTGKGSIDVLLPLVRQTLKNVETNGLEASLTGPLKRGETAVVQKHLQLLDSDEAALYRALTRFLTQSHAPGNQNPF
jgi:predicted short-subunit dehydrogenase-like oxidoreductase (DUF2520 family)